MEYHLKDLDVGVLSNPMGDQYLRIIQHSMLPERLEFDERNAVLSGQDIDMLIAVLQYFRTVGSLPERVTYRPASYIADGGSNSGR